MSARFLMNWKPGDLSAYTLNLAKRVLRARQLPDEFAELCFADPAGQPLWQAVQHRHLQEFLGRHDRALIELPRDHGKSLQVCIRILWELGRDPSLRVKI